MSNIFDIFPAHQNVSHRSVTLRSLQKQIDFFPQCSRHTQKHDLFTNNQTDFLVATSPAKRSVRTRLSQQTCGTTEHTGHLPVTRLLVVGAGLSPATPDGGGSSAAALAAAGNHKAVLRLLQKSCPGVSLKAHNGGRRRSSDLPGPVADSTGLSGGDRSRRKHERRIGNNREPQQRVSINPERGGGGGGGRGGGRGAAAKGAEEAGHRLFKAARNGDTIAMGEVLARGEVGVEWVGRNNGWTAVMEAAEHGSLEGVCYLVDMG